MIIKLPKVYRIDYSKVVDAEYCLYQVTRLMADGSPDEALAKVQEARELLQDYLDSEPLIEDSNLNNGLVKVCDIETCTITTT